MNTTEEERKRILRDYCDDLGIPYMNTDAYILAYGEFQISVVLPRVLAERRRRAGDPSARPHDFCSKCGIGEDLRHRCCGRRPGCPYAAGADVEANKRNSYAYWEQRQAVAREIAAEYIRAQCAPDGQGLTEFARWYKKRKRIRDAEAAQRRDPAV